MKTATNHVSYYINVGQTLGILGGLTLGFRALRLEEQKAGIQNRPLLEVIKTDIGRIKVWYSDTFGTTKQYTHY